jgi:hypothetical protein
MAQCGQDPATEPGVEGGAVDMRGRSLVRIAVLAQAVMLAGALIVPAGVAAATLGFTLNSPSLASVNYSDLVTLRGSYTCVNDGASNCPTTIQSSTATFSLRPAGGDTFSNVGTVASSFTFTASGTGCPSTCTSSFQLTYKAGRAGSTPLPPGVYDIGLTATLSAGQQVLLNGLTITAEGTTTTYGGLTAAMGNTSLALSANVVDLDKGQQTGTGIYSPDANLLGAGLVTFALYDATNTTLLVGPVSATLLGSGLTTGSPTMVLPSSGGTLKLRTTFVGNSFYTSSEDLDTITVTASNTPPVLTVPASPIIKEATSSAGATVSYSVSAADAEDEPDPTPACLPASGSTFPIGDTTVSCTVSDTGLLDDTDTFVVRVVDSRNPGVSVGTSESDNGNGWYNVASNDDAAGVTIELTTGDAVGVTSLRCTDNGDDLGALDPSGDSFVVTDGSHQVACTVLDAAGNIGSDTATFQVDQTAPSISAELSSDPDATTGWWNAATGAPTVSFVCSDGLSGIAAPGCPDSYLFGEGADQAWNGTVSDNAGNASTAGVTDIDVDLAAPTGISFLGSDLANGESYYFGTVPAGPTGCTATDPVSGLEGCEVDGYSMLVGAQSIAGTVRDDAGNAATTILEYTVLPWTLRGFANPISTTGVNTLKSGTSTNLKLEGFAGQTELTSLESIVGVLQTQVSCGAALFVGETTIVSSSKNNPLSYQGGQLVAKWDAPSQPGTCWIVSVVTADGSSLSATFKLK